MLQNQLDTLNWFRKWLLCIFCFFKDVHHVLIVKQQQNYTSFWCSVSYIIFSYCKIVGWKVLLTKSPSTFVVRHEKICLQGSLTSLWNCPVWLGSSMKWIGSTKALCRQSCLWSAQMCRLIWAVTCCTDFLLKLGFEWHVPYDACIKMESTASTITEDSHQNN